MNGREGHEDRRGNATDRRARRRWLLDTYGDGERARCSHCPVLVTAATLYVDRIVPGRDGGRYTRDNIRPSCGRCSCRQGYLAMVEEMKARSAALYPTPF